MLYNVELLDRQTKDILRELAKHGYEKLRGLIGKHTQTFAIRKNLERSILIAA